MNQVLKSLVAEMLQDTLKDNPDTLQEYYDKLHAFVLDIIGEDETQYLGFNTDTYAASQRVVGGNQVRKEQRERLES